MANLRLELKHYFVGKLVGKGEELRMTVYQSVPFETN